MAEKASSSREWDVLGTCSAGCVLKVEALEKDSGMDGLKML